ncbi:hypothetical protein JVT61DRAFT_5646 [Boletus reticuloceps]|uniref:Uncharacterized protein n=1 Tax=Boletus reticuloceps TaxID=495285 RepID=A0A8I2Z1X2_9AGAM|nr:hypothetical protein JVT61DRAFT_5646 [Boletus reticuloceps]
MQYAFWTFLLTAVPESVVCGWDESGLGHGMRILEGYLGILSAGTKFGGAEGSAQATSTASVILSPQSKLVVLQSLSSFLSHAIDHQPFASGESHRGVGQATVPVPTWFVRSSFVNTRLYEEHAKALQPSLHGVNGKHLTWSVDPDFESFDEDFVYDPRLLCGELETIRDLSNLSDLSPEMGDVSRSLGGIPLIMPRFLMAHPVVFSPSTNPTETEVQMLMAAFKITRTLYGAILQSVDLRIEKQRQALGGYANLDELIRMQVEQAFQDLSVIYCELLSLLVLVSHQSGTRNMDRRNRFRAPRHKLLSPLKSRFSLSSQVDLVKSYVIRLLQGDGGSGAQLSRPISVAIYTALLPTIWALLNQRSGDQPEQEPSAVLTATLDHAMRASSVSAVKRLTVEFVGRLLLLEKEVGYIGHFNARDAGAGRKFQEWLLHLPKALWQVGTDNFATTQAILGVLLRLAQRGSHVVEREQISSLSSRLTPFFMIVHPIRGQVLGPFSKIPSSEVHVRYLTLDLCASLVTDQARSGTDDGGLCHAVSEAVKGTREEPYWDRVRAAMRGAWCDSRGPPEIQDDGVRATK